VSIVSQPSDQSVVDGGNAAFAVNAVNARSYQWQRQQAGLWTDIAGATAAQLTVSAVKINQSGQQYRVVVAGDASSVTSSAATLTVVDAAVPVRFTLEPQDVSARVPGRAEFEVAVAGVPTPTLQWQASRDATSWQPLNAATSARLALEELSTLDDGLWVRAVATNSLGTTTSRSARLRVSATPSLSAVAGWPSGKGHQDGAFAVAQFFELNSISKDQAGNLYVTDPSAHVVRKIDLLKGMVSTVAGQAFARGHVDGAVGIAKLDQPRWSVVDAAGNLFVAEGETAVPLRNSWMGMWTTTKEAARIRKISTAGVVTTLYPPSGVDPSTAEPVRGMAFDSSGNFYFATSTSSIRKVSSAGVISNWVQPVLDPVDDGITGPKRWLEIFDFGFVNGPGAVLYANVKLSGSRNRSDILVIGLDGSVKQGSADGLDIDPKQSVRKDASSYYFPVARNEYVFDVSEPFDAPFVSAGPWPETSSVGSNPRIIAGSSLGFWDLYWDTERGITSPINGLGTVPGLGRLRGMVRDQAGTVVAAVGGSVGVLQPDGSLAVFAGAPSNEVTGVVDGQGTAARFTTPQSLAAFGGSIYLCDGGRVRVIDAQRLVKTLAQSLVDDLGQPATCRALTVDTKGNLFVLVSASGSVVKIAPDGTSQRVVQTGTTQVSEAAVIAVDANGNLYLNDAVQDVIHRIRVDGLREVWAGVANGRSHRDGARLQAKFYMPLGMVIDSAGALYVADYGNHAIRRVDVDGTVTTVLGRPDYPAITLGDQPTLRLPRQLALAGPDQLLISDQGVLLRAVVPGVACQCGLRLQSANPQQRLSAR
jgi:sugar lactone lactonase YvrE